MTVKARERSLSNISIKFCLHLLTHAYKAIRSVGTKRHGNQTMIAQASLTSNVAASLKIELRIRATNPQKIEDVAPFFKEVAGPEPTKAASIASRQGITRAVLGLRCPSIAGNSCE